MLFKVKFLRLSWQQQITKKVVQADNLFPPAQLNFQQFIWLVFFMKVLIMNQTKILHGFKVYG